MPITKRDYYNVLGLKPDQFSEEARKKAYRRLALKFHPDHNPGDPVAEARFKELSEANKVLKDPQQRRLYDAYGHAAINGASPKRSKGFSEFDFSIFNDIWGFGTRASKKTSRPSPGSNFRGAAREALRNEFDLLVEYFKRNRSPRNGKKLADAITAKPEQEERRTKSAFDAMRGYDLLDNCGEELTALFMKYVPERHEEKVYRYRFDQYQNDSKKGVYNQVPLAAAIKAKPELAQQRTQAVLDATRGFDLVYNCGDELTNLFTEHVPELYEEKVYCYRFEQYQKDKADYNQAPLAAAIKAKPELARQRTQDVLDTTRGFDLV